MKIENKSQSEIKQIVTATKQARDTIRSLVNFGLGELLGSHLPKLGVPKDSETYTAVEKFGISGGVSQIPNIETLGGLNNLSNISSTADAMKLLKNETIRELVSDVEELASQIESAAHDEGVSISNKAIKILLVYGIMSGKSGVDSGIDKATTVRDGTVKLKPRQLSGQISEFVKFL